MPESPELEEKDTLLFIREKLGIHLFFKLDLAIKRNFIGDSKLSLEIPFFL